MSARKRKRSRYAHGVGLCILAIGCGSDHHVSPWPKGVTLNTLMRPTSLQEHTARIDDEMRVEGLVLEAEIEGQFEDGEPFCIRAYQGPDEIGHLRKALRVATRYGIIMALGPSASHETLGEDVTSFIPALGESGAWKSGSDINGDGMPDVLVSRPGGVIEVWGLHAKGSSPYPIESMAPMSGAMDVDGDGRPDLVGRVPVPRGDALAPRLMDVATFSEGRYRDDTRSARAFHRDQLRAIAASDRTAQSQLEIAWHAIRAGGEVEETLEKLDDAVDQEHLSGAERASLSRWRGWMAAKLR